MSAVVAEVVAQCTVGLLRPAQLPADDFLVGLLIGLHLAGGPQAADLLLVAEVVAGHPAVLLFAGQLHVDLHLLHIDSFFAVVGLLPVGILVRGLIYEGIDRARYGLCIKTIGGSIPIPKDSRFRFLKYCDCDSLAIFGTFWRNWN